VDRQSTPRAVISRQNTNDMEKSRQSDLRLVTGRQNTTDMEKSRQSDLRSASSRQNTTEVEKSKLSTPRSVISRQNTSDVERSRQSTPRAGISRQNTTDAEKLRQSTPRAVISRQNTKDVERSSPSSVGRRRSHEKEPANSKAFVPHPPSSAPEHGKRPTRKMHEYGGRASDAGRERRASGRQSLTIETIEPICHAHSFNLANQKKVIAGVLGKQPLLHHVSRADCRRTAVIASDSDKHHALLPLCPEPGSARTRNHSLATSLAALNQHLSTLHRPPSRTCLGPVVEGKGTPLAYQTWKVPGA